MDMFENFMAQLTSLTKAQIIEYGQLKGIWSSHPNTTIYLKKQTKTSLCRTLADRLTRLELRGY